MHGPAGQNLSDLQSALARFETHSDTAGHRLGAWRRGRRGSRVCEVWLRADFSRRARWARCCHPKRCETGASERRLRRHRQIARTSRCARVALQRNMVEQAERLFSPAAGRLLQECLARKRSALRLGCTNKGQNSGGQRPDQQSPSRYRTAKRRGWRRETHPVLTPSCSRATPRTVSNPSRHGRHPPHIC